MNHIRRGRWGAWAVFAVCCSSIARGADVDGVLNRLQRAEKEIKTVRFSFVQTTHLSIGNQAVETRGEARFERPDRFRVDQTAPEPRSYISDGKRLWIVLPERRQAIKDSVGNLAKTAGFPQGLTPFRMNVADMKLKYDITLETGDISPVLVLVPKKAQNSYTLRLWVDDATGLALRTELSSESFLARVVIENPILNEKIDRQLFYYVPPSGTDVMDSPFH